MPSGSGRTFSIVREIAYKELWRHRSRFIGITVTVPRYIDQGDTDTQAHMEWVADVRVDIQQFGGSDFKGFVNSDDVIEPQWGLLKNVVISQWVVGAVADMNVPVLLERNEAGRISIIARSNVRLPDIRYKTYSYNDLEFLFMQNLIQTEDLTYEDGFGYSITDPTSVTGVTRNYTWSNDLTEFGGEQFEFGTTPLNGNDPQWVSSS